MNIRKQLLTILIIFITTISLNENVFADTDSKSIHLYDSYCELVNTYNEVKTVFPDVELDEPVSFSEYTSRYGIQKKDIKTEVVEEYAAIYEGVSYSLSVFFDRTFMVVTTSSPTVTVEEGVNEDDFQNHHVKLYKVKWRWYSSTLLTSLDIKAHRMKSISSGLYKFKNVEFGDLSVYCVSVHYFARETVYYNQITFKGNMVMYDDSTGLREPQFGFNVVIRVDRNTGRVTATTQIQLSCY